MHVLPWRYSGRHSNSRGEETTREGQACAVSLHPTDSPEDHVQLLTECSKMSEELTQNPHTPDQCVIHRKVIREATKGRLVCDLSSLRASYLLFLKDKEKICLIQSSFTVKIIHAMVKLTSSQSHFVIPHWDRSLCSCSLFRNGKVWTRIFQGHTKWKVWMKVPEENKPTKRKKH